MTRFHCDLVRLGVYGLTVLLLAWAFPVVGINWVAILGGFVTALVVGLFLPRKKERP